MDTSNYIWTSFLLLGKIWWQENERRREDSRQRSSDRDFEGKQKPFTVVLLLISDKSSKMNDITYPVLQKVINQIKDDDDDSDDDSSDEEESSDSSDDTSDDRY